MIHTMNVEVAHELRFHGRGQMIHPVNRGAAHALRFPECVQDLYGDIPVRPCPFTPEEIAELEDTNELLVYLPARLTPRDLCERWGIRANFHFENEKMIRTVMNDEDLWFITSASPTPELMYHSGLVAKRLYEDNGLFGMDLRRYLAFVATFRFYFQQLPDASYWTFLLAGSYDRSGISVVGFDRHGILNHHGWMKNFKAKFTGSRYVVIAPRIEITAATAKLPRAYRDRPSRDGLEADVD